MAYSVQQIGDLYREHNQEADHVANLGAEGVSKSHTETDTKVFWTAAKNKLERVDAASCCKQSTRETGSQSVKVSVPLQKWLVFAS